MGQLCRLELAHIDPETRCNVANRDEEEEDPDQLLNLNHSFLSTVRTGLNYHVHRVQCVRKVEDTDKLKVFREDRPSENTINNAA